ncbi:HET-domain-containing protein [Xylaria palmicola]|nr:HET-domain-containing protein [Xylaria palmicola]
MALPIYQPLKEKDEIRIISLLPYGEDPDAPIQCRLEHVRLEQRPQYEALSYTWGDQSKQHPISVDAAGSTVDVGENCLFALRSLRRAAEPRRLWIDALCINQADLDEKTEQLPIVGDVYQSASETIIFLQYSGSDQAFHGRGAGPEMQRCWDSRGANNAQPRLDEAARREVFDVQNYPWFRRGWIVQETLLSFNRTVLCPPFTWPWETFIHLVPSGCELEVIRISEDYSINSSNMGGWNHVWDGQIRERMPGDMPPISALDYLVDTRDFQCKLYHDRVYSILSMFNPQLPIAIDYHCSKEELYENLSGALLEVGDSRFLYSTHRRSWRVNWNDAPADLVGDELRHIGMSRAMMSSRMEARWCALGYLPGSSGAPGKIRGLSFKVGEVTKISRSRLGSEVSDAECIKRRWDDIMTELELPVHEKETGAWPAIHIRKRNHANQEWYREWMPGDGTDAGAEEVGGPSEKPRGSTYSTSAAFFKERPLYVCEAEGIVGIGTQDLRVGDEIWYVCGLNVPVCALRQIPKKENSSHGDEHSDEHSDGPETQLEMVGLCFLGVSNEMRAMRPVERVFPHGQAKLLWIV